MKIIVIISIMVNFLFAEKFCIIVDNNAVVTNHRFENSMKVNLNNKFGYGFLVGKEKNNFIEIVKDVKVIGWIEKKYLVCSENLSYSPYIDAIKVQTKNNKDSMLYKKYFYKEHTPKHSLSTDMNTNNENMLYFALKENEHSILGYPNKITKHTNPQNLS